MSDLYNDIIENGSFSTVNNVKDITRVLKSIYESRDMEKGGKKEVLSLMRNMYTQSKKASLKHSTISDVCDLLQKSPHPHDISNVYKVIFKPHVHDLTPVKFASFLREHVSDRLEDVQNRLVDTYVRSEFRRLADADLGDMAELLESSVIDIHPLQEIAFREFLVFLAKKNDIVYPKDVHENVYEGVLRARCKSVSKKLTHQSKDTLQEIAHKMGMSNYLQLEKDTLCRAIDSIILMSHLAGEDGVAKCMKNTSSLNNMLKGKIDYGDIKREVEEYERGLTGMSDLVAKWRQVDLYRTNKFCKKMENGECSDLFASLYELSTAVSEIADTCNKRYSQIRRKIKHKEAEGQKFYKRMLAYVN